jgi:hypothetical protein
MRNREVVKQSLADDACLDEDMVCVELAFDVVAVFGRGAVEMLVTIVSPQRLHVLDPEVIAERTDLGHGLLKGEPDLEAQAVESASDGASKSRRDMANIRVLSIRLCSRQARERDETKIGPNAARASGR